MIGAGLLGVCPVGKCRAAGSGAQASLTPCPSCWKVCAVHVVRFFITHQAKPRDFKRSKNEPKLEFCYSFQCPGGLSRASLSGRLS